MAADRGGARRRSPTAAGGEISGAARRICRRASEGGFDNLVALAETVGAAVYDVNARLNFPNRHPLNLSMEKEVFRDADLILSLDTRDWEKSTHVIDRTKRPSGAALSADLRDDRDRLRRDRDLSKWSMDYGRMPICSLRVLGDTLTAIPELTRICRERIARTSGAGEDASPSAPSSIAAEARRACSQPGPSDAKKDWDACRSRCRASPAKCGTRSRPRTGC